MKLFSALRSKRPLNRSEAWKCAWINQLATPGFGSLFARRFVAGCGQLLLALAGFGLFTAWFIQTMRTYYGLMFGNDVPANTGSPYGKWGVVLFGAAWLWSLVTSFQIICAAPKDIVPPLPPKIF
jgi:hypothetical protein